MNHATPARTESAEARSQPMSKSAKKRQKQKAKKKVRDRLLCCGRLSSSWFSAWVGLQWRWAFGNGLSKDSAPFCDAMLPSCSTLTTPVPTCAQSL